MAAFTSIPRKTAPGAFTPYSALGRRPRTAPAITAPGSNPISQAVDSADFGEDMSKTGTSVAGSGATGAGGSAASPSSGIFGFNQAPAGTNVRSSLGTNNATAGRLANSSASYGNFAGIASWLGQPGQNNPQYGARAQYLAGIGVNPSYNGVSLTQLHGQDLGPGGTGGGTQGYYNIPPTGGGAGAQFRASNQDGLDEAANHAAAMAGADAREQARASGQSVYDGGWMGPGGVLMGTGTGRPLGAQVGDGAGGIGSGPAGAIGLDRGSFGAAGALGQTVGGGGLYGDDMGMSDAYRRLISGGGNPLSSLETATMRARSTDPIARGTQDSIEDARLSALRRGDFSGSTLPDAEARIRRRGANDVAAAGTAFDVANKQGNLGNLLESLSGAGNLYGTNAANARSLRELEILAGQLQQQGGFQGGLQYVLGNT